MTETNDTLFLSTAMKQFVLHWGEMGTRWGVNRSVAQVHALLYLSPEPLSADVISTSLGIARSNVSGCLKELQSWNLAVLTHKLGDRRDHFETSKDPWELFSIITEERKKREIDPVRPAMGRIVDEMTNDGTPEQVQTHIREMRDFIETTTKWYEQMRTVPRTTQKRLIRMGLGVLKFLPKG